MKPILKQLRLVDGLDLRLGEVYQSLSTGLEIVLYIVEISFVSPLRVKKYCQ